MTVVLVILGPGLLLLAALTLLTQMRFQARALPATGTVVACAARTFTHGRAVRSVYMLTVRFVALDGQEREFRERVGRPRRAGSEVGVQYDPADPERAQLAENPAVLWTLVLAMTAVGAVMTVVLLG